MTGSTRDPNVGFRPMLDRLFRPVAANDNTPPAKTVRAFSACGPCLKLGRLTKTTAQFYIFDEWRGGDRYEGSKRVRIRTPGHYSPAHVEPCRSCQDHAQTQYPNSYMD
jgi:hypothetical protein